MSGHPNSTAALRGLDDLGERRRAVLKCFEDGVQLTDRQVAEHLGWELYVTRPRITELTDDLRLFECDKAADHVTGRTVRVSCLRDF